MTPTALRALSRAIMTAAPSLPLAALGDWMAALEMPMGSYGISTLNRSAAFIAQVAYESAYFTRLQENLNYSAARLFQEWPTHFASLEEAEPFAMQPEKLANRVYGGRFGNGDEASGDGWRFRGQGLIQLTFRDNYARCGEELKMSAEGVAAFATTPPGAARTACWFWSANHLNAAADAWEITTITKAVSGSDATAQARLALANKTKAAMAAALLQMGADS